MLCIKRKFTFIFLLFTIAIGQSSTIHAKSDFLYAKEATALYDLNLFKTTNSKYFESKDLYDELNRETAITFLVRIFGEEKEALMLTIDESKAILQSKFSDFGNVSEWAIRHVAYGVKNGYINGYPDSTLQPKNNVSGREVCSLYLKKLGHTFDFNESGKKFGEIATISEADQKIFGISTSIKKDILMGISFKALTAKSANNQPLLVRTLIDKGIVNKDQLYFSAPEISELLTKN